MNGDNNLEEAAISDFVEMVSAPLNGDLVNVVVQLDRSPGYVGAVEGVCDNWSGTLRFVLSYLMAPYSDNAVSNLGEVNMGRADALVDFVSWAVDNYPAQHYALIIWDHGDGWRENENRVYEPWKVAGYDETSGDYLYMDEVQTALRILKENGYEIDLIGFDACLMGMVEVAYELKDYASFMVASEDVVPGEGWRYDLFLEDLISTLIEGVDVSPIDLGRMIIESYKETEGSTLSLIDLKRMDDVASLLRELSSALRDDSSLARVARAMAQEFYDPSIIDLYSFASYLAGIKGSSTELAFSLCEAIKNAVIENYSLLSDAHGLSVYFPERGKGAYDRFYEDSRHDFSLTTGWGEFIRAYLDETREVLNVKSGSLDVNGSITDEEISGAVSIPPSEASPFKAYFKNDGNSLYLAVKVYSDTALGIGDSIILYIDSDGNSAFPTDRGDSEGMLRIVYDGSRWVAYFYPMWYDHSEYKVCFLDSVYCPEIVAKGGIGDDGFLEVELKVPFERFSFKPGSVVGYYLQIYDGNSFSFVGEYPYLLSMGNDEQIPTIYIPARFEPSMYYGLRLAEGGSDDDNDSEFVASSGCSLGQGKALNILSLLPFGWIFIWGVRRR